MGASGADAGPDVLRVRGEAAARPKADAPGLDIEVRPAFPRPGAPSVRPRAVVLLGGRGDACVCREVGVGS
jgi:hypothetical protein